MDPLSIAATVISLAETGLKLKNSVDQVPKTRGRARELAEDAHSDLLHIAMFYERNQRYLASEALGPLRDSLDRLRRDLYRLYDRCQQYESKPEHGVPNRFKAALLVWINSSDIEVELARLKGRIQTSLNMILLLSCARMEVGILRIQEEALLSPYGYRTRVHQFDRAFAQGIYNTIPGSASLQKLSTEIDEIDIEYMRAKATKIAEALSNLRSSRPIMQEGPFEVELELYIGLAGDEEESSPYPIDILAVLTYLTKLWVQLSLGTKSYTTFRLIVIISSEFVSLGCPDVAWSLINALESLMRRLLLTSSTQKESLLRGLEIIQFTKATFIKPLCPGKVPTTCAVAQNHSIECKAKAVQLGRTRLEQYIYPSNPLVTLQLHLELTRYMSELIPLYYNAGRMEDCTDSCLDALELLSIAGSSLEDLGVKQAYVLQHRSYVLYILALAQRCSAQYTLAYHTGLQCVAGIKALSCLNFVLPEDFHTLRDECRELEMDFHSLTSIVREPSHSTLRIEEYQWGIAI